MKKLWSDRAWDDYLYWQMQDKKTLKRINELVKSIEREGLSQGIGKPEPLRHRKAWSRRIDEANREDCSKNSRVLKAHKYSIFGNLLSIRKMQDVGISRPICCYTSKLIRKKEIEQAIFIYNLILTRKAAFLTPTQENRNAAFFMPSCYAVRANKALIYAALRARK